VGVIQGHTGVGAVLSLSVSGASGKTSHLAEGARQGDAVTLCKDVTYMPAGDASACFESRITVDGHVAQLSGDLAGHTIALILVRPT